MFFIELYIKRLDNKSDKQNMTMSIDSFLSSKALAKPSVSITKTSVFLLFNFTVSPHIHSPFVHELIVGPISNPSCRPSKRFNK